MASKDAPMTNPSIQSRREMVLEIRNVSKQFFGVPALRDVSVDLRGGEIHAIVGENGAGKSTLMKILSGSYSCDEYTGEIRLMGQILRLHSPRDAERAGIAMIYQELSLHLDLTIGENIFLGRLPTRLPGLVDWPLVWRLSNAILERVGLDESPRTVLRQLSQNRQQRVAIAKALAQEPSVIILDEPTAALTAAEADLLMTLLLNLKGQGYLCFYISHRLDEVMRIADRVTVLRDGARISTYDRNQLNADRLIEDMVGRRVGALYPVREVPLGEVVMRVRNLTVPHPYIPSKNLLEDVSLDLRQGEILGLAGLVGSGRSELVKALFGVIEHDGHARIEVDGREVSVRSPHEAIDMGIGLVTEDRKKDGYVWTMDLKENMTLASLRLIARRGRIDKSRERELAEDFVERLSIRTTGADAAMDSLSGGNQQKAILAKWLMRPLKVLILDEPARGIDVGAKAQIYHLMNELVGRGMAIIMISSELPELLAMCDRLVVLARGRIRDEFSRDEASAERLMRAATIADTESSDVQGEKHDRPS